MVTSQFLYFVKYPLLLALRGLAILLSLVPYDLSPRCIGVLILSMPQLYDNIPI
jgi:hypothetical protein